jgi:FAD/FMN-containing dehydrogenase
MVAWVRAASARLSPHARPGAYSNFVAERSGRSAEAYGANAARLARIKARYDPENLFRFNQNIAPSTS